ncbi:hypothetical protein BXZ70DRAFT_1007877 [Cristinia sonorae]|uniref:Uncharacterized protein n=1 Tax=Cristinia sonorae TaxID=1940300 RepID=A0A8K0XQC8_9AGAR|nr:hypothetical protein BXZ70DRAFT_1007877 [Cristinia sonorae]
MALSYAKSCLIGALMECIAYGIYFTYFTHSLRILRRKLVSGRLSIWLSATTIVLFVLITMRLVLDNKAAVEAFTNDPLTPDSATMYYTSYRGAMFRTGTYIALTIVADIFIVYRVFVVWAHSYVMALVPALLAIADIVSGALVLRAIDNLDMGQDPNGDSLSTPIIIFYSFTLGLNVLSTILIAYRIHLAQRQAHAANVAPSGTLKLTMTIVVESALIYSAFLVAMLVPTATGSNVQFCLLSVMPGVVGTTFSLIIVRAGSGQAPHTTWNPPRSSIQFASTRPPRTSHDQSDYTTDMGTSTDCTRLGQQQSGIELHLQGAKSAGYSTRSDFELKEGEGVDVEKGLGR